MRRDVFQAIADPTRREIIHLISRQSLNVNSIAGNFDMSRPAISKHMKILTECGLVIIKEQGRERVCEAKLQKLTEVSEWVEQYRIFWTKKLDALQSFLNRDMETTSKSNAHRTRAGKHKPIKKFKRK